MRLSIVKKKTEIYYYILDSYRDKKDKSKVITKRVETWVFKFDPIESTVYNALL